MTEAQKRRAEELRMIEEYIAKYGVRRFAPGGALTSAEEAVNILRGRGYKVTQRLGSFKVHGQPKGMNAEEIMAFGAYVRATDSYPTVGQKHAAQKAYFAAVMGQTPRKAA